MATETSAISFDTWGLLLTGVLITLIMLAFRKMFPKDPPEGGPPGGSGDAK
jgi:hypothetical protein